MKNLVFALLFLAGCASVNTGRTHDEFPQWVRELAAKRQQAQAAVPLPLIDEPTASRPAAASRNEVRPATVRLVRRTPERRPARAAEPVTNVEKLKEGLRLLREADEMRRRTQQLHDAEESALRERREALLQRRAELDP